MEDEREDIEREQKAKKQVGEGDEHRDKAMKKEGPKGKPQLVTPMV